MTIGQLICMGLVNDSTKLVIRRDLHTVLAHGFWFNDNLLAYVEREIESFTWQDDDTIYIDIK